MKVYSFDYIKNNDIKSFLNKIVSEEDIVIFHGSLQHGRQMSKLPFYPGIFLTIENYECYNYYGHFGDNMLNSNYLMMGLNDVIRNKNKIFDIFNTNKVFIRPSNGYKTFTGQLLSKDNFDIDFDTLTKSYGGLNMNTLVLLAPEQDIEEEYRFIVIDNELISGSLYMDKNNRSDYNAYYDRLCVDKDAISFAEKMSKIYQPDLAYNIDICRLSNGEYKVMEINSFCCGSLYGNDYTKIVDSMNKLSIKEYLEYYI